MFGCSNVCYHACFGPLQLFGIRTHVCSTAEQQTAGLPLWSGETTESCLRRVAGTLFVACHGGFGRSLQETYSDYNGRQFVVPLRVVSGIHFPVVHSSVLPSANMPPTLPTRRRNACRARQASRVANALPRAIAARPPRPFRVLSWELRSKRI